MTVIKLKGQTAIVTYGGRGTGKAISLVLAREEVDIVITVRTEKEIR